MSKLHASTTLDLKHFKYQEIAICLLKSKYGYKSGWLFERVGQVCMSENIFLLENCKSRIQKYHSQKECAISPHIEEIL